MMSIPHHMKRSKGRQQQWGSNADERAGAERSEPGARMRLLEDLIVAEISEGGDEAVAEINRVIELAVANLHSGD